MRTAIFCLLTSLVFSSPAWAQAPAEIPVFKITTGKSTIKFGVDASVSIEGTFDKWDAALTLTSPEADTAVFAVTIYADSVDTGSTIKNNKLKGKDFFDVAQNPLITFKSTKLIETGPDTIEVDGNFTIRGVTKPEKLKLTLTGKGTGAGHVEGTMAFDRRDYGMNSGIPFIKVANRVQVTVNLFAIRVSGPPLVFKH